MEGNCVVEWLLCMIIMQMAGLKFKGDFLLLKFQFHVVVDLGRKKSASECVPFREDGAVLE